MLRRITAVAEKAERGWNERERRGELIHEIGIAVHHVRADVLEEVLGRLEGAAVESPNEQPDEEDGADDDFRKLEPGELAESPKAKEWRDGRDDRITAYAALPEDERALLDNYRRVGAKGKDAINLAALMQPDCTKVDFTDCDDAPTEPEASDDADKPEPQTVLDEGIKAF